VFSSVVKVSTRLISWSGALRMREERGVENGGTCNCITPEVSMDDAAQ